MQLNRRALLVALLIGLGAACARPCAAGGTLDDQTVGSLLRIFSDSKHVAVRSAMADYSLSLRGDLALALHWNNERVTIPAIDAAVGTEEAVDAITTASRPIAGNAYSDFTKTRNELQGELSRGSAAVDYYYSTESDYLGQQIGGRFHRDFLNDQLNVATGTSYGWDAIKPLADDDTNTGAATKTTLHWNAVATQVVTSTTLVRVGLEYNWVDGLQHNPYRNVYAGGTNVAERHPDHRERRDAFLKLSQYLPNRSSVKLHYRIYNDDWGIVSHEIGPKLSQYVTQGLFAQYEYRYYTQSRADFHSDSYATTGGIGGYLTGDYRLGPLSSHLFGVAIHADLGVLAPDWPVLGRMGVSFNYERYFNSNNYSANLLETGLEFHF